MEAASSLEDLCRESKTIHVLELVKEEMDILQGIATEQLKLTGVQVVSLKRRESRSKTRTSGSPGPTANILGGCGSSYQMVEADLGSHNTTVTIPKFLKLMCTFIKNHLDTVGLFRVEGNGRRISTLTNSASDIETEMTNSICVYDVCSALKSLIRNMEVPLIPTNLHYVFLRCLELPPEQRSEAMSLAVLLLPRAQLHMLFYLMEFLHEVTGHSEKNKMNSKNLAIVFAPNILLVTSIAIPTKRTGKDSVASFSKDLQKHVDVLKILIDTGDRLGVASHNVASALIAAFCKNSEDELESEGEGRKRKRRSASLNRRIKEFWRKKSTRNAEKPVADLQGNCTPGINTPIIMSHSRKRSSVAAEAATPLSTSTKNRIMSVIQKKRFVMPDTPTGPAIAYPSPAVCLNPRPDVKGGAGSVVSKGRMGRSLYRSNGSRCLAESLYVRGEEPKSILAIVPLANSPRRSLPRQRSPATSTASSTPLASEGISDTTHETGAREILRFTPMLREINELTLAALEESPALEPEFERTPNDVQNLPVSMEIENVVHNVPTIESELPTAGIPGEDNCRITRSKFRADARRCQSFNDALRPRTRKTILRRRSDATGMALRRKPRTPTASPMNTAYPRRIAQSLTALNRSPTRCTLRRGRPNTTKTGLPRPSPQTVSTQSDLNTLSDVEETPNNIVMDRKGRVSRRVHKRPSMIIPPVEVEKSAQMEQKIVKPPRTFNSKLQSPKKVGMKTIPESPSAKQPLSYVASKLKREEDGTVNMILKDGPTTIATTPLANRKGRSCSMRSDMIRPSPNNKTHNLPYNSMLRKASNCENAGINKMATNPARPMRRGLSVQELVKKFDSCSDVGTTLPTFSTFRRERNMERPSLPDFTTRNRVVPGVPVKQIAPAKPPRSRFAENPSNVTTGKQSTKQTEFNTNLTRSSSNATNISRGSKQVLKTMNLP